MPKLTWLGHASWHIQTESLSIVLDPFFADNPKATVVAGDFASATHVLVSHGHFDHVADVAEVVKISGATLISNFEIAEWFQAKQGITDAIGMNIGGNCAIGDASLKMTPAVHSSSLPDGSYGGTAAGFVLNFGDCRIYFACDTAYFAEMKYYAAEVDLAVLPIGDLFTMGIDDSLAAIQLINPKVVLPTHYGTWPPIEQDVAGWAARVDSETGAKAHALAVGESFEL